MIKSKNCCKDCESKQVDLPCCPVLNECDDENTLDFYYRVRVPYFSDNGYQVLYEVTLHYQLVRLFKCYSPGDIAYSTTLLPGETVKLFSNDRRSTFSIDSESQTAVRQAAFSEDSHYLYEVASTISNVNVNDLNTSSSSNSHSGSNWNAGGSAGLDLGFISIGGGGGGGGSSSNSNSLTTVLHQLNQHSQTASQHAQISVNSASSISIGEVHTRSHTSGESEDIYESSSKTLSNTNKCHAVTYYFYRINKCYESRYKLVDVHFRVLEDGAFNSLIPKPLRTYTGLTIAPVPVLATSSNSLNVVTNANNASNVYNNNTSREQILDPVQFTPEDIQVDKQFVISVIKAAIGHVKSSVLDDLINSSDSTTPSTVHVGATVWYHAFSLASPGFTVKGCLDPCNTNEDEEYIVGVEEEKLKILKSINSLISQITLDNITTDTAIAISILAKLTH